MTGPHFSPASSYDRRCTTPSGVFSLRGARRTVKYDSAPREARPEPPASSVASAMAPYSRRRDDGDVSPSSRSGNNEDGAMAPQPFGPMGIAADLFVARRRRCSGIDSSSRLDLGSRAPSADGTGGSGRASRGAESYLTVRRAPRSENTPLGGVRRRPQLEAGEICGLGASLLAAGSGVGSGLIRRRRP